MAENTPDNSDKSQEFETHVVLKTKCDDEAMVLQPMQPASAQALGPRCADIDPWKTYGISAEAMTTFLAKQEPAAARYTVMRGDTPMGAICIRRDWLRGPYLQFLCILPEAQRLGLGAAVLDWFETNARADNARQSWIMVSEFNSAARTFYARHGYLETAAIPDVVADGYAEILLRKKLA